MPKITGEIRDALTGERLQARVQIIGPTGEPLAPNDAMWKRGPGEPFFYSDGQFSVDAPRGYSQVLVERGTEFTPWRDIVEPGHGVTHTGNATLDIKLERWGNLPERGWHPGNTHIHYDEKETDPDRRLAYDSRVENLRMTAVSVLKRWDLDYATNKYPPGMLTEFTDTHHYVQSGEESRHNHDPDRPYVIGYGHVMLLNIRNIVEPVSRGLLVDPFSPDYPPLSYVCDDAQRQGGLVIWCHNGQGMEAPVAAAHGRIHAINLFDPYWNDVEYDLWYHMLNCGIKLPASTGSDWFVSSGNRVYANGSRTFDYEDWLKGIKQGNTFITNGPALYFTVDGMPPGSTVESGRLGNAEVKVEWQSHYPVEHIEIVMNGDIVSRHISDKQSGVFEADIPLRSDGWIAARVASSARDSFYQPIWAHSSPVYVTGTGRSPDSQTQSARFFVERIDEAMDWVSKKGKFYTDAQRNEVLELHKSGQEVYRKLI